MSGHYMAGQSEAADNGFMDAQQSPRGPAPSQLDVSHGLYYPPAWWILLCVVAAVLSTYSGVNSLRAPVGETSDSITAASFMTAGLAIGAALSDLKQRRMVKQHMLHIHPGSDFRRSRF
jgi:hypothetical protein